jgi:hypothetical protein
MASERELLGELNGGELNGTEWMSVEAISKDVDLPLVEIVSLYKVERASLVGVAKIPTYIPVIASRNVRIKLKQLNQPH